ncbi:ethanolamine ammonia-lyase reactivating factor EutA [Oceanirhabdus sp. W0125-5]|uniref:ethanolamine ammonia-lyase reactivating factor EutA n=1 Tax=Oceanirhabdus sp. W0125-5 TaxID=2999116 RepID=UPI0022F33F80|nr:ethanolamine ammonia-lyase reactivating factor EutA [Oceanirhabdus sp. W0125-5]WBW94903.1 ethanolamine ammonia-lyase reactivating factor EutA [Oceanirhabdus sp. W0125-5]
MKEDILSVGIDIGTSTTQLVFSRISIENTASSFSIPRIKIVDKQVIYRSNIYFTPLISNKTINGMKVREIIEKEYAFAGVKPSDVKTGAVIITGETARKENANEVLQTLSGLAGDFVVATAGPDLESIIAGKGAGADLISKKEGCTVVNLDIGGGTTNLSVFRDGEVADTGCLDIGGRLIKIDKTTNRITYIASKIKELAKTEGINIDEGQIAEKHKLKRVTQGMVRLLEESLNLRIRTEMYERIITNKGLRDDYSIDFITFSGGVADYINIDEDDVFKFGDIGVMLGQCIRNSSIGRQIKVRESIETIRATVVGAGSHTTDISGSTITYSEEILPIMNLPILKLSNEDENNGLTVLENSLKEKLKWFDVDNESQQVGIALKGPKNPTFTDIQELSQSVIKGIDAQLKKDYPVILILENDIAKVVGQTIYKQLKFKKKVICIDSIKVENGDYMDIGKPLVNGRVVPVVIKTLVFNS